MELKQLELAEAKARVLLLNPIDEENPGCDDDENDVDDCNIQLKKASSTSAVGEMIDFAALSAILSRSGSNIGGSTHAPREEGWRAMPMLDDDDIIEAPRSYSMPSFKKDVNKTTKNKK